MTSFIDTNNLIGSATFVPFGRAALDKLYGKKEIKVEEIIQVTEKSVDKFSIPTTVTPENLHNFTYYQLLGINNEFDDTIDVNFIKKQYHKAVLVYHPDKTKATSMITDDIEDNEVFLKIQEALDTLSNSQKKRVYDSQLPFDDTIPREEFVDKKMAKKKEYFYKIFEPVFKRNARFAAKKPIPSLGDDSTPMAEVLRFYDYWVNFDSWRDFSGVDSEHKIEENMSREEKRYYQKENERNGKKLKKKEMERIMEFVNLAQKKDPRINAEKEARKLAKEQEKFAKEEEIRKKVEEEAALIAAFEKAEIEAKELVTMSKADKEKMKKTISKARNIIRKLLRHTLTLELGNGAYGILTDDEQEFLCSNSTLEELNLMNNSMGGEPATKDTSLFIQEGTSVVLQSLNDLKAKKAADADAEKQSKAGNAKASNDDSATSKSSEREWSRDHASFLAKAIAKFPAGSPNRWVSIVSFMNDSIRPSVPFGQNECIKYALNAAKAGIKDNK